MNLVKFRNLALFIFIGISSCLVFTPSNSFAAEKGYNFKLKDLAGKTYRLSSYRNQVVYLDFWASWCTPCKKSFPWMNKMHQKYHKKGFRVVAINLDSDSADVKAFLKENKASFKILLDPEGTSAEKYKVIAMPSSYLIDRKGRIQKVHHGFLEKNVKKKEAEIAALLK